ncbi:hypothetical protein J6590_005740 [Homalodisca vitripennis]|nr:hypothetical protein J6590_005740 [Homalodisca vitripennis]
MKMMDVRLRETQFVWCGTRLRYAAGKLNTAPARILQGGSGTSRLRQAERTLSVVSGKVKIRAGCDPNHGIDNPTDPCVRHCPTAREFLFCSGLSLMKYEPIRGDSKELNVIAGIMAAVAHPPRGLSSPTPRTPSSRGHLMNTQKVVQETLTGVTMEGGNRNDWRRGIFNHN